MKIKKILNNNAALALDDKGNEIVYTGCGLCFQKKIGDEIDEGKIEKTFVMEKPNEQFKQLVSEMPYEQIQVADEIIKYAGDMLNKRLCNNIYIKCSFYFLWNSNDSKCCHVSNFEKISFSNCIFH